MIKKLCKIDNLAGEELLAKPIATDDYNVLLPEGTVLKQEYIEKLRELNVPEVYVWVEAEEAESVVILKEDLEESLRDKVKSILERHTYSNNKDLAELSKTADRIISNILQEKEVVQKVYDIKERDADIYEHSISICSLATIVALKLELPYELVHDIGVSCLLHDLGLRYLTVNYSEQNIEKLPEAETAEYKKHPVYGYSALQGENWISPASKNMILYHHERLDGSGYPLHATDIPLECRIIQICDAFDELICGIGCERVKVYEAVAYLKKNRDTKFDKQIVDIFLQFTAVYPVGSCVKTNEGEIGIVLRQNSQHPDRPLLKIIKDSEGRQVDILKDLLEASDIFIEKEIQ